MQQHNLHVSQAGSMFLFHGACSVWVGARAVAAEAVCWPCNAVYTSMLQLAVCTRRLQDSK